MNTKMCSQCGRKSPHIGQIHLCAHCHARNNRHTYIEPKIKIERQKKVLDTKVNQKIRLYSSPIQKKVHYTLLDGLSLDGLLMGKYATLKLR